MIIEDSQVELKSFSSYSSRHNYSVEKNFKSQLSSFQKTNFTNKIEKNQTIPKEIKNPIFCLQEYINKFIVEMLLSNFLNEKKEKPVNILSFVDIFSNQSSFQSINTKKIETPQVSKTNFTMETTYEYSKTNLIKFESKANIQTTTGDVNIDLNIQFTQKFYEKHQTKIEQQRFVFQDPLVIQFDISKEHFNNISTQTFTFDINSNGFDQEIPLLKEGSGFLALDKNKNKIIDDGTELFGPSTNNGFNELSFYDEDNNNWIDEQDSIFKDLAIWCKDYATKDRLITISQANIGAIYLGDIKSQFNYDKNISQNIAQLKSTSIFLDNQYNIGLITGVNFAKQV